jgi:hypothetical protein
VLGFKLGAVNLADQNIFIFFIPIKEERISAGGNGLFG